MTINSVVHSKLAIPNKLAFKPAIKLSKTPEDSFKKNTDFNVDEAIKTFDKIKVDCRGVAVPKFDSVSLNKIKAQLEVSSEKFKPLVSMAQKKHLSAGDIAKLSQHDADKLEILEQYSNEVDSKRNPRYFGGALLEFAKNDVKTLVNAQPYTKTSLSVENMTLLGQAKSLEFNQKAAEKVLDFENNVAKNEYNSISFQKDFYNEDEYTIIAESQGKGKKVVLNKNLETEAIEDFSVSSSNGIPYYIQKCSDLKNNIVSKIRSLVVNGAIVGLNEVRIIKDKNGKVVRTEYSSPSEVKGVYDIVYKTPDGKEKIVSSGKVNPKTGITTVKKDMKSVDGTRTTVLFEDDPQGNRISEYKIVDKNGKVLLNNNSTFEVISENKFISTKNDQKYEIVVDKDAINVTDLKNKNHKASISIENHLGGKTELLNVLKSMPGEELFKIAQTTSKLNFDNDVFHSHYLFKEKSITSADDMFTILHELGHAKDFSELDLSSDEAAEKTFEKIITNNSEFREVYEKECENFNNAFPDSQRLHIDYFINQLSHPEKELGRFMESVAESNALLTTPKSNPIFGLRSQYLQQYFPKTIAKLDELLNQEKVS